MIDKEKVLSQEFAKRVANKNDGKIQHELQLINFELFGEYFLQNCGPCVKKAYVKIREHLKSDNMIFSNINQNQKKMSNFKIAKSKNGASKQIHTGVDIITNDNLTDEKAIAILAKSPAHIKTFETFPANWQELVAKFKEGGSKKKVKAEVPKEETPGAEETTDTDSETAPVANEEMTVKELKALCPEDKKDEWKSLKKAELIEYING